MRGVALTMALLGAAQPAAADELVDRIAAVVNGRVIMLSEVQERAEALGDSRSEASLRNATASLVDEALLATELDVRGIEVSSAEVEYAVDEVRRQAGLSEDAFREAVEMQGYRWDAYLEELKSQLRRAKLINAEVRGKVEITEGDVRAELVRRGESVGGEELRARHILVAVPSDADEATVTAARERALTARARVTGGEAFEDVAREVSEDGTASDGGDLGWFGRGLMVPAFEETAFATEAGTVSEPVRTRFGWHLIKVEARRRASEKKGTQAAEAARRRLYEQEVQRQMGQFLDGLRRKAVIEYKLEGLAS